MAKVLVIDDEKDIQEIISNLISSYFKDSIVETQGNGLDGFIAAQKQQFDLIITDHKMPFMTGAALAVALRTRENSNKDTPIIMLSAFITPDIKSELGMQNIEFMEKPLDYESFINHITPLLV
jgi:CheY-like chemotaxis protein